MLTGGSTAETSFSPAHGEPPLEANRSAPNACAAGDSTTTNGSPNQLQPSALPSTYRPVLANDLFLLLMAMPGSRLPGTKSPLFDVLL